MAEAIKMPKLSDTMTEGVIAQWHKKVGDAVAAGDLLAEIESDKATMEYESFPAGTLLHIEVPAGKSAAVDSVIAIVGKQGEDFQSLLVKTAATQPIVKAEPLASPAPRAAVVEVAASRPAAATAPAPKPTASLSETNDGRLRISPLARRLAAEMGTSLRGLKGTGDHGRIVKRDVERGIRTNSPQVERYRDVDISQMRKTIARRLAESKFTAPHFYLTIDLDMDAASQARAVVNEAIKPEKISINDLVIKAAAVALLEHPQVNAGWHDTFIRYNEHVHIGVAVAVDEGLLVPVVRFAEGKSLTQIGQEVRELAGKAKSKKLQPAEWEGNTFTISNLGMFGIEEFTAIINPPDSCIMAVGAVRTEAVVKNGQLAVGQRMKVTLSCDHRVVDGATGAKFLETFKRYMEQPILLLGRQSI